MYSDCRMHDFNCMTRVSYYWKGHTFFTTMTFFRFFHSLIYAASTFLFFFKPLIDRLGRLLKNPRSLSYNEAYYFN